MTMIITGQQCENCIYSDINDDDKSRIRVYCGARDRSYWWGQCVPCEDYRKKEDND